MTWNHLLFTLSLGLLLTGCAMQQPPIQITPAQTTHITSAGDIQQWKVQGALGVNDGKQAFSARVAWTQGPSNFAMSLYGPIGVGTLQITGAPGRVTLMDSSGKKMVLASAEDLLKKQTGWSIPVNHLLYWIKGLPVPGIESHSTKDKAMNLAQLKQDGWQVDYLGWSQQSGVILPTKLAITNGILKIRLVISQWQVL